MLRRFFNDALALIASVLVILTAGLGAAAYGATPGDAQTEQAGASAPQRAKGNPFSSYSKTSEFAQRLQLVEFSDKRDSKCAELTPLLAEMRKKNYPIQRVEPRDGGETLYRQYNIQTIPTFVLLFDGKELGRVVVKKDSVRTTRDRLLKLFQHGRDAVASRPLERAREPEFHAPSKPLFGFLFHGASRDLAVARGQNLGLAEQPADRVEDYSFLDAHEEELSSLIGESRLNAGAARVEVESPDGAAPRRGDGVTVHYNSEYKEALVAVAASLFVGIDDPFNKARVQVEIYSSEAQTLEKRGAQCVYCDYESGIAFVAAQVDRPATPVAFLPKKTPLEVGERASIVVRNGENVVKTTHDVLALDQRRFYKTSDGADQSAAFLCVEISNAPDEDHNGAGLFVERNERYYFAGLYLAGSRSGEGCVAPIALISRSLLVNRNLAAVYRDQIAGKFDSAATDAEIDSAIAKLVKSEAAKRAQTQARAKEAREAVVNGMKDEVVQLSQPTDATKNDGAIDFAGANVVSSEPTRVDDALAAAARTEPNGDLPFPANAKDAFAQSDALANAIAERQAPEPAPAGINESFVIAQTNAPENEHDVAAPVANQNAAIDAPATQENAIAQKTILTPEDFPVVNPPLPPTGQETTEVASLVQTSAPTSAPDPLLNANGGSNVAQNAVAPTATNALAATEPVAPEKNQVAAAPTTRYAAYDGLPTPNSEVIRSTTYSALPDLAQIEIFDREEEQFEAAVDALRRRSMEGAEIICIVNWSSDPSAPRETEVVRLPKRTALENPRNPKSNVELASKPGSTAANPPMTSNLPNGKIIK